LEDQAIKGGKKNSKKALTNENITAPEVRLVGAAGEQVGIVSLQEAQEAATKAGLDLVQMVAEAEPPVCKVMDYGKHLFDLKKQQAAARKKQKQTQVKEIKFRPGTDIGDYKVKLRNLIKFLEAGDKAKITMRFRGREMAHQDIGMDLLKRIEVDLEDYGVVEQFPKMEGRQMSMVLSPKKKK
jgi:translation initiation factor IF-3